MNFLKTFYFVLGHGRLTNSAVIVSGEQGLSHTYTRIHPPPDSCPVQAATLSRDPCAIQEVLVGDPVLNTAVCVCPPQTP